MRRLWAGLTLLAVVGCSPSIDELFLTESEIEALELNFEASVDAQQLLAEFIFASGRGDIDPALEYTDFTYDPPSLLNGWLGTLNVTGGTFSFGTGDLVLTFTALGDGLPVDPALIDLTTLANVEIDADVTFFGTSLSGAPLIANADLVIDTVLNGSQIVETLLNGTMVVNHDGYVLTLAPQNLGLTFDMLLHEVTNVTGSVPGQLEIPDFIADAEFVVTGLGDSIEIAINAAATTINYTLDLIDL